MSYNRGKNYMKQQRKYGYSNHTEKLSSSSIDEWLNYKPNRFESIPRMGEDWKKENQWYNDMNLYHITTIENSKKIEESGGLKGNTEMNKFHRLSEKGYIYTTLIPSKLCWDIIKFHQLFKTERDLENSLLLRYEESDYVVYRISGSSLLKRGIPIFEDLNDGKGNQFKCVKFYVGDDIIPLDELQKCGTFTTFNNKGMNYSDEELELYDSSLEKLHNQMVSETIQIENKLQKQGGSLFPSKKMKKESMRFRRFNRKVKKNLNKDKVVV